MKQFDFDFIVVGSGLAGLLAAYHASEHGSVALLSKSELDISNSYHAQGGIAAAIDPDDHPLNHFNDTLTAGRGLCDHDAVSILVKEGLEQVQNLIKLGIPFDKDQTGEYILGLEGGHSHRRILHADGDATGKIMTSFMLEKVKDKSNITAFEYNAVISILIDQNSCLGVQTLDFVSGENYIFKSRATILATGGLSRIYSRSTNPYTATGDGIALAWKAGARLCDMEFIQFHPTALSLDGEDAYLISEAVRGEGAHLLDIHGIRFMPDQHPMAELAPRDVVASAIFQRMQDTGSNVFLSLKHLEPSAIKERFHSIYAKLLDFNLDLTSDLIPIAPAAHYTVGGIRTDLYGQTNIAGLFACGEVASTGVMGANRLASNSLLECLVYGKRVVEKAKSCEFQNIGLPVPVSIVLNSSTDDLFLKLKNELSEIMTNQVGIVRNGADIRKAVDRINAILQNYESDSNDYNLKKIVDLATICKLIAVSALKREESRGGHVRSDFQAENDAFIYHIIQEKGKDLLFENVRI